MSTFGTAVPDTSPQGGTAAAGRPGPDGRAAPAADGASAPPPGTGVQAQPGTGVHAPPAEREARLLVHRAGGTPVYVYSRDALRAGAARVRAASPAGARLYYSLKANPHPGVVGALAALVDGFDVCSTAELETALNASMPAASILFTGPAKSRPEAAAALAAGVAVTVESVRQARLFAQVAAELGVGGRAVLRLNAPYPARDPGTAPAPNHFGVPQEDLAEAVEVLRGSSLAISGLHLFWGSQYSDARVILAARASALRRALDVAERYALRLDFVDVGGGIAMPWCAGDPPVDWAALTAAGADAPAGVPGGTAVVCEYGRALAGPAGSLLTTVLDTKVVDGRHYVLVDAGMNHVAIAGRLIAGGRRGEPLVSALGPARPGGPRRTWVTGPLCSQLDVLAEDVALPPVEPGDLLAFSGVGAYGPTFSPAGFLSREAVREIVY
ncbi:alanine racemase [Streptomyces sp. HPF1205]|uniref:alanine racemase n=1 Tax=Streptomyces sp. HPF1205 TaxID=2873262 RepID=UPI001CEC388C|nr:alanine racemase [Streptomyces sp. HPF1205]